MGADGAEDSTGLGGKSDGCLLAYVVVRITELVATEKAGPSDDGDCARTIVADKPNCTASAIVQNFSFISVTPLH